MRRFIHLILLMSFCAAGARAAEQDPDRGEGAATVPTAAESVLALAPECDRAVCVSLDGAQYAVALLHAHWRLAATTLRVRSDGGEYRLTAAFNRDGVLAEVSADPPARVGSGFAEACLGLRADAICPDLAQARTPLAALAAAAVHFDRLRVSGRLERAVTLALAQAESARRLP